MEIEAIKTIKEIIEKKVKLENVLSYYIYKQTINNNNNHDSNENFVRISSPLFSSHLNEDFETAKKVFELNFPNEVGIRKKKKKKKTVLT